MQAALWPLLGFAVAASVTPGPNNMMVAASAANHGVRATLPHMLGIAVGFALMLGIVGAGIAAPLARHPELHAPLQYVAAAWLAFIAWKIGTAEVAAPGAGGATRRGRPPMGFVGGALFQWVNPKAWLLCLGAAGTFVAPGAAMVPQVALLSAVFLLVCLPCCLVWAGIGRGAGRVLRAPGRMRAFNVAMGVLLAASVLPALWGE